MPVERLQKILAAAGFGSRRACEELIVDGHVTVNGKAIRELPCLVDSGVDQIVVDGRPVRAARHVYFLLNKPAGVLCTHNDPSGRTRAVDLLRGVRERVFPVGRLDSESMGLLILTNDGELTQRLTHPRFSVPKTYRAEVAGLPSRDTLEKVRTGVWLAEGKTAPGRIEIIHKQKDKAILEITLRESRNREVRRMFAKLGHKVRRLTRIRMGRLSIAHLPLGEFRKLTDEEVKYLRQLADRAGEEPAGFQRVGRGRAVGSGQHRPARPRSRAGHGGHPAQASRRLGATVPRQGGHRPKAGRAAGAKRRMILPK